MIDNPPPTPLRPVLPGGSFSLRLVSHLEEHLRWMARQGRARKTLFARRRTLVRLAEFLAADPIAATVADLERWQDHLLAAGNGPATLRQQTALIRPFYGWAQARGYRRDDPSRLLATPRRPRRQPRPMSEDRVERMLVSAPARVVPWLLCAGWLGLRAGEIAAMAAEDFTRGADDLLWLTVTGKGGHQRRVPVEGWLEELLAAYVPASGPCWRHIAGPRAGEPVSAQMVSQLSCQHLHRVGIPDTLHALRHRVGTITYERTQDLRVVQELLGHASPETTAMYTHVAPTRVAAALRQLPRPGTRPAAAAA